MCQIKVSDNLKYQNHIISHTYTNICFVLNIFITSYVRNDSSKLRLCIGHKILLRLVLIKSKILNLFYLFKTGIHIKMFQIQTLNIHTLV